MNPLRAVITIATKECLTGVHNLLASYLHSGNPQRVECALVACSCLSPGGVIIMHDTERQSQTRWRTITTRWSCSPSRDSRTKRCGHCMSG